MINQNQNNHKGGHTMLTLWKPFGGLFNFSNDVDDWFSPKSGNGHRVDFTPAVDIEEKEDQVLIHADLPGVSEKDIEVKVHDGVLILSGKREMEKEEKTSSGYYRERNFGSFYRSFTLGDEVNPEKIEARYKNGVLEVKLPKKEETKPREIKVKTN